ncbi:MAG: hypothetical protein AAGD25_18440 [Cyanobacteria bacterium P01_F01_bin.150]
MQSTQSRPKKSLDHVREKLSELVSQMLSVCHQDTIATRHNSTWKTILVGTSVYQNAEYLLDLVTQVWQFPMVRWALYAQAMGSIQLFNASWR